MARIVSGIAANVLLYASREVNRLWLFFTTSARSRRTVESLTPVREFRRQLLIVRGGLA
ncbi:hypothetical protein [Cryobacterium sp. PH31-O1]|uniref:hypothetical protein n=1 Tax=Cryobacterium sp. PH31-O1 TaxID=3046306 RepID=UPI0024B913E0|nr:hypothetical protein [Cryobacterium sp. PH31-O1]MDJ0338695.1 hypothetical protein [Cryobacterium sp. PH31-O1]